jgi:triphosphoribosyl-dephospho-CoA synthetase
VTLLEAMRAAQGRDRIAWNYANGFADIFELGRKWLIQGRERWGDGPWAVTRVYLGFLAHLPDTLIERKFGAASAALVREEAAPIEAGFTACQTPDTMTAPLMAFDRALKERGLNPGTSADLTVATRRLTSRSGESRPETRRRHNRLPTVPPRVYVHAAARLLGVRTKAFRQRHSCRRLRD